MKKKLLAAVLSAALITMSTLSAFGATGLDCTGTIHSNDSTHRTGLDGIDTVHIIADGSGKKNDGCNVTVRFCDHEELLLEYNKAYHRFSVEQENETATIRLYGNAEKIKDVETRVMNRMVLHLPRRSYKLVKVDGTMSGVAVEAIDANLELNNTQGAMSVELPRRFTKTLNYTCDQGASALTLDSAATNYTLNIETTGSAVALPDSFPSYAYGRPYAYTAGDGGAKINLKLNRCAMAVRDEKD